MTLDLDSLFESSDEPPKRPKRKGRSRGAARPPPRGGSSAVPKALRRWLPEARRRLGTLLAWRGETERPDWAPAIFGGWLLEQPYASTGRVLLAGSMFDVVRKELLPRRESPRVLGYRARRHGIELVADVQLKGLYPSGSLFTEAHLDDVADDVAVVVSPQLGRSGHFDAVDLAMALALAKPPVRLFLVPDDRAPLVVHDAEGRQSLVVPLAR